MLVLPSVVQRFVDKAGGIIDPWVKYLQQFTIAPPSFMDITPDGSPFEYVAKEPGNIHIDGATSITLIRGTDSLDFTGAISVPVAVNDTVEIIYGGPITITFIPSYGYNTTSS